MLTGKVLSVSVKVVTWRAVCCLGTLLHLSGSSGQVELVGSNYFQALMIVANANMKVAQSKCRVPRAIKRFLKVSSCRIKDKIVRMQPVPYLGRTTTLL